MEEFRRIGVIVAVLLVTGGAAFSIGRSVGERSARARIDRLTLELRRVETERHRTEAPQVEALHNATRHLHELSTAAVETSCERRLPECHQALDAAIRVIESNRLRRSYPGARLERSTGTSCERQLAECRLALDTAIHVIESAPRSQSPRR